MSLTKVRKICIISPSLKIGGIERSLVVLANYFQANFYDVTFISCLAGKHFYQLHNKISLIEPTFQRKESIINKFKFYSLLIIFIRRKVKVLDPDVVISFGDWFNPLVLISLLGTNYPVFISDRTSPDYNFKFPIPILKKLLYPKSKGFIAQSIKAAEIKKQQFGNKLNIQIIPNAIRTVIKHNTPREKIILYVGRFAWEKGPDRLIKAFYLIDDKLGWKLHMAGSGPLLEDMKELVIKFDIQSEVIFHGEVKDIDFLYSKSSIYVLPSLVEGFANSLCEAMAVGLPVICFDSIPYEDIITSGINGIVIDDGNIDKLSSEISLLMINENERVRLGNNASKIKESLNTSKIGNQILNFIHDNI